MRIETVSNRLFTAAAADATFSCAHVVCLDIREISSER